MKTLKIKHPDLPGREVEIPEISWPHHARSGWVRATDTTTVTDPEPTKPPKRRREVRETEEN